MIRVELERRKRGLTQAALGEITKIPTAEICRIERSFKAYPGHLKRLSEYFSITGEQLLKEVK